jgi:hypothetical protein
VTGGKPPGSVDGTLALTLTASRRSTGNHDLLDAVAGPLVLSAGFAISRTAHRFGWLKRPLSLIGN